MQSPCNDLHVTTEDNADKSSSRVKFRQANYNICTLDEPFAILPPAESTLAECAASTDAKFWTAQVPKTGRELCAFDSRL
jgi:hypothetical protein